MRNERDVMKTRCGFCKSSSVMEYVVGKMLKTTNSGSAWTGVFTCHHCDFYMLAYGAMSGSQVSLHGSPLIIADALELAARVGTFKWYPSNAATVKFDGLPENIEKAASEAHACLGSGQLIAAAITARATLEAIAKDHGITERLDLYKKIEKLREAGDVTRLILDQAHAIRDVGNDMAHGDFESLPDKEEIEHVIEFMDALIDTLYVQPVALKAAQEKRASRKGK